MSHLSKVGLVLVLLTRCDVALFILWNKLLKSQAQQDNHTETMLTAEQVEVLVPP